MPEPAPLIPDAIPPELRRTGGTPRQVLAMCVIGTLVLGLFASRDLPSWTERFADAQTLQRRAADWDDSMAKLGLVRPHEALRAAITRLLEQGWDGGS